MHAFRELTCFSLNIGKYQVPSTSCFNSYLNINYSEKKSNHLFLDLFIQLLVQDKHNPWTWKIFRLVRNRTVTRHGCSFTVDVGKSVLLCARDGEETLPWVGADGGDMKRRVYEVPSG